MNFKIIYCSTDEKAEDEEEEGEEDPDITRGGPVAEANSINDEPVQVENVMDERPATDADVMTDGPTQDTNVRGNGSTRDGRNGVRKRKAKRRSKMIQTDVAIPPMRSFKDKAKW